MPYAPISTAYSLASRDHVKLRHIVGLLTPGMVFVDDGERYAPALAAALQRDQGIELVALRNPHSAQPATPFAKLLASAPEDREEAASEALGPDTIAKFLFTSGSTNLPKAVTKNQRMLCSSMAALGQCWQFLEEEEPVLVDWLPWNHTFGGNLAFNLPLYFGGSYYIDEGKPVPGRFEASVHNLKALIPTVHFNVPRGFEMLARTLAQDEALRAVYFQRLRMQLYGGASLGQPAWDALHRESERECGRRVPLTCGLRMTETSPGALWLLAPGGCSGQVGVPAPGVDIKLVPEDDTPDAKIELCYRGPNVMPGYWRQPDLTNAVFDADCSLRSRDAVRWADLRNPHKGLVYDGRLTEDFKLDSGTWVSARPLRMRIQSLGLPLISDAVIAGRDHAEVGALLVADWEAMHEAAGVPTAPAGADGSVLAEELLAHPAVRARLQALVDALGDPELGGAGRVARAGADRAAVDGHRRIDRQGCDQPAGRARPPRGPGGSALCGAEGGRRAGLLPVIQAGFPLLIRQKEVFMRRI
ncbi:MAG: AMP-binding protein [Candidatus Protistobacter heckmanni]|nr:AMP-binding protein [Candidatus Protistobacter heckmanni]